MRMWKIDPKFLCNKHLLGAHGEIHKFKPTFEKQHNVSKRILLKQIEPSSMKLEHDLLAIEMLRRGMNHKSDYELPNLDYIPKELLDMRVDSIAAHVDLIDRCLECRKLLNLKMDETDEIYIASVWNLWNGGMSNDL